MGMRAIIESATLEFLCVHMKNRMKAYHVEHLIAGGIISYHWVAMKEEATHRQRCKKGNNYAQVHHRLNFDLTGSEFY